MPIKNEHTTTSFHAVSAGTTFVTVILPVAVPKEYTYFVPAELVGKVRMGMRVEVQFGRNKLYAALVTKVHQQEPAAYKPKGIISVIDQVPIVYPQQVEWWRWIAKYYCCTIGEVMHAALPAGLKLSGETVIHLSPLYDHNFQGLNDKEFMIMEALTIQNELTIKDVRGILDQKTVYPLINGLLEKRFVYLQESLKDTYKPKTIACVRLQEPYASQPDTLEEAFEKLSRSNRQVEALMAYLQLEKGKRHIRKQDIYDKASVDSTVLKAMEKKGVFELYEHEVSRIQNYEGDLHTAQPLTAQQIQSVASIKAIYREKNVCLLHGVTGSGKTRVYIEMIQDALNRGEQILYLLPEIAITAQIINRLQQVFGDEIVVYHSRLNDHERVEIWKEVYDGKKIVVGVRSSLFLPFQKLGLIVIDEEHDPSYKQYDPAPRYNARDSAIYLAHLHGAKTLLGTATPSIESYQNAKKGKYGLVQMKERFGGVQLPEILVVNKRDEAKKRKMQSHFTSILIQELKMALEQGEQAILFQNRRGYAPVMKCTNCEWTSECINCDVSLTYHKHFDKLRCHYCGFHRPLPQSCPACGSKELKLRGFGTEKVEDELKIYLPEARIQRMDLDTTRGKHAHARIIHDFEERRIDILVGTQMVTKGLDFDNVGVVGILSADQMLQFPDFRAGERAFQLMTQVSGRAGRHKKRGLVVLQAFDVHHPVITEVLNGDFEGLFQREVKERKSFDYPPFARLIKLQMKHRKPEILNEAGKMLAHFLKQRLGERVKGPAVPYVSRVRGYFLLDILIKLELNPSFVAQTKRTIAEGIYDLQKTKGFTTVRVNVDVDPY